MSGYTGNADAESEHALILSENGIEAHRAVLRGAVLRFCKDCGEEIPAARREFAIQKQMKCEFCVECQSAHDKIKHPKMLDRIL